MKDLKSSTNHRLFLGVELPDEWRQPLASFIEAHQEIPGIRWTPLQNLHLTTYFIGTVPAEVLPNLMALIQIGLSSLFPFDLTFSTLQIAPKASEARMIWAGFEKSPAFTHTVLHLHETLGPFLPQQQQVRKSPKPHITLARLRQFEAFEQIDLHCPIEPKTLEVREMILWESISGPAGAQYKELSRYIL